MTIIKGTAGDVIKGSHYVDTTWRSSRTGWVLRYRITDRKTTLTVPQGLWAVTVVARNGQAFNVDVDVPEGDTTLSTLFVEQGVGAQIDVAEVRREAASAATEAANTVVSGVVESAKEAAKQVVSEASASAVQAATEAARTAATEAVRGARTAAVDAAREAANEVAGGAVKQAAEAAKTTATEVVKEALKNLPAAPSPAPAPGGVVTGVESVAYVRGADVTKDLQAALDSPNVSEIILWGESVITSTMWLDKASGKRIGSAVGAVLKAEPTTLSGPAMFCARAGVGVHHLTFRGLVPRCHRLRICCNCLMCLIL